jgi:hypothetical protein
VEQKFRSERSKTMSNTITVNQEIKVKIGDKEVELTKEEATVLYNKLGKILNKDPEILPFTTPQTPYYTPLYPSPSTPIPNWNEYEMPPYRRWFNEPIMCVVREFGSIIQ